MLKLFGREATHGLVSLSRRNSTGEFIPQGDTDIQVARREGIYPPYKKAIHIHVKNDTGLQIYAISLAGVHPERIPVHLPFLLNVLINVGKITKVTLLDEQTLYTLSRHVIDGPDDLCHFLQAAKEENRQHLVSLVMKAESTAYISPRVSNRLEKLPSLFSALQKHHLCALKHLEINLAPGMYEPLKGWALLIENQCLLTLETCQILFSKQLFQLTKKALNAEDKGLFLLYSAMNPAKLPKLRELQVTMWCCAPTLACLQMLHPLYPQLSLLKLDRAETDRSLGYLYEPAERTSLQAIIQRHAENNRLHQLTIIDHSERKGSISAFDEIVSYYRAGWLPHLTTYAPTASYSDIPAGPPLEEIHLCADEASGFLFWLQSIQAERFPKLKRIYYRFPEPTKEEKYNDYIQRLKALLTILETAYLPHLEAIIFEGNIPAPLDEAIKAMEIRLLQRQFTEKLKEIGLVEK